MRTRSGVVVIRSDSILLMFRRKEGREYFILPGGSVEKGETPEMAAVRELKEETGLDIVLGPKLLEHENEYGKHFYFLAESFEGDPVLGGDEALISTEEDFYDLQWVPLKELISTELYHPTTKELLIEALADAIGS